MVYYYFRKVSSVHTTGESFELCCRSDFAVNGPEMKLNKEVERVLKEFHAAKKPIGLCCIAPVLAAKALPNPKVTLGKKGNYFIIEWKLLHK